MDRRNKWNAAVSAAGLLAFLSVMAAAWMVYQYGFSEQVGLGASNHLEEQVSVNMPVIMAAAFQAIASILFACLFGMLNGIYKNTVDIWAQGQNALRRQK